MMTDPISDFLVQIKNGYMANKEQIEVSYSKIKDALAELLLKEGYLGKVEVKSGKDIHSSLVLQLLYNGKRPKIKQILRVSKPGKRVYVSRNSIPKVLGGIGLTIISTSCGIITGSEAKKKGLGGELICKIW